MTRMTRLTLDEYRKRIGKPAKRPKKKAVPLTLQEMRNDWAERNDYAEGKGDLLVCLYLPLDLCQRQDARLEVRGWKAAKMKREVTGYLRMQCLPLAEPIAGRPYVRCVRLSSGEPDKYADWAKLAVDCLCAPNKRSPHRLNIIKDDAPKFAEIDQQWRLAKPGKGYCVFEVYSGI